MVFIKDEDISPFCAEEEEENEEEEESIDATGYACERSSVPEGKSALVGVAVEEEEEEEAEAEEVGVCRAGGSRTAPGEGAADKGALDTEERLLRK